MKKRIIVLPPNDHQPIKMELKEKIRVAAPGNSIEEEMPNFAKASDIKVPGNPVMPDSNSSLYSRTPQAWDITGTRRKNQTRGLGY